MKLSINERGVRLTLPPRSDPIVVERFLLQQRDWLRQQWHRCHGEHSVSPLRRFQSAELPLHGMALPLHWREGTYGKVELASNRVIFQLPAGASDMALRNALREFYESQARADIGRWLPKYLPGLPSPPTRIRLKVMSSQWGSLAPNGALALDLALTLGRPSAFEYVLVHELCHLIHHNHSAAFWQEVTRRFPTWRDERDYFRREGRRLKTLLHALLHC
jgi:predicted metal-dependent hydrolase